MTKNSPKEKNKGRPVDNEKQAKQKQKLLDAALTLLDEKNYKDITIRELGKHAGINSAMVSYYFNNKEGLFIALLDQISENHFSKFTELHHSKEPIKDLITFMLSLLNQQPGLMKLIHNEAMSPHSNLRPALIERFPKRMAEILPALITQQQALGKIRQDINARYAAFSLISLIIMPFLTAPIREDAWGIKSQELNAPQWTEHIYQLFIYGITQGSDK